MIPSRNNYVPFADDIGNESSLKMTLLVRVANSMGLAFTVFNAFSSYEGSKSLICVDSIQSWW